MKEKKRWALMEKTQKKFWEKVLESEGLSPLRGFKEIGSSESGLREKIVWNHADFTNKKVGFLEFDFFGGVKVGHVTQHQWNNAKNPGEPGFSEPTNETQHAQEWACWVAGEKERGEEERKTMTRGEVWEVRGWKKEMRTKKYRYLMRRINELRGKKNPPRGKILIKRFYALQRRESRLTPENRALTTRQSKWVLRAIRRWF